MEYAPQSDADQDPKPPRSRRSVIIRIAAVLILIAISVFLLIPREPSYKGKSLSVWLESLNDGATRNPIPEVEEAIKAMGTNALPFYCQNVRSWLSAWKIKLYKMVRAQPLLKNWVRRPDYLVMPSLFALQKLGTNALPIIPHLLRLGANEPHYVSLAFFCIGPPATFALEVACASTNSDLRVNAASYLAMVMNGVEPNWAWASDASGYEWFSITFNFGDVGSQHRQFVLNLQHTNANVRLATALALKRPGFRLKNARLTLERLMQSTNAEAAQAAKEVFSAQYPNPDAETGGK